MERKNKKQRDQLTNNTFTNAENDQAQMTQGIEETQEQINDTFSSGNNDVTFLRDGKDMAKKTKQ